MFRFYSNSTAILKLRVNLESKNKNNQVSRVRIVSKQEIEKIICFYIKRKSKIMAKFKDFKYYQVDLKKEGKKLEIKREDEYTCLRTLVRSI